ncbi:MAG: DUF3365 domain-containing protein [Pirellulaceae bacterium]|nr:DUF3365 domain-containing protein [Pirellulaceae bacterium]
MMKPTHSCLTVLPLLLMFAIAGCQDRNEQNVSTVDVGAPRSTQPQDSGSGVVSKPIPSGKRNAIAAKAKDALFTRLSGRLMEVMQSDGPAAAINVCSNEAVTIAQSVGKEHGVEIGRTSFKLRNSANAPRDWVKPLVEKRVETPQRVQLEDGSLGVVYPIRMTVKCLMCHGGEDDILDAVKPELAKLYPRDAATGFKLDDLRGWFWVEVPSDTPQRTTVQSGTNK